MEAATGFEPVDNGFADRPLSHLGMPPRLLILTSYVASANGPFCRWLQHWLQLVPLTSCQALDFLPHHLVAQACVPLGRNYGSMPQDLLECCQGSPLLHPTASKSVPELVRVKTLNPRLSPAVGREPPRTLEWEKLPHSLLQLLEEVWCEGHPAYLAALGLRDD